MQHDYYSPHEAAKFLGLSPITLANWRSRNIGPAFSKLDESRTGRVVYHRRDLQTWLAKRQNSAKGQHQHKRHRNVSAEAIRAAILRLDPDNPKHWVPVGRRARQPRLTAVNRLLDGSILHYSEVDDAAPGLDRDKIREIKAGS